MLHDEKHHYSAINAANFAERRLPRYSLTEKAFNYSERNNGNARAGTAPDFINAYFLSDLL